ncbi:MAG: hypothetical protein WC518_03205 [Patescibacteria group bacterium]
MKEAWGFLKKVGKVIAFAVVIGIILGVFFWSQEDDQHARIPIQATIALMIFLGIGGIVWEAMGKKKAFYVTAGLGLALVLVTIYRPAYLVDAKAKVAAKVSAIRLPSLPKAKTIRSVEERDIKFCPGKPISSGLAIFPGDVVEFSRVTAPFKIKQKAGGYQTIASDEVIKIDGEGQLVLHGLSIGEVHIRRIRFS